MKHLLTLALSSCLALAACGSEANKKDAMPDYQVDELNRQTSLNAFLLTAEKAQKTEAKLLLCANKGQWTVIDQSDKAAQPKAGDSCSSISCSLVSNRIGGAAAQGASGWLCQPGTNASGDTTGGQPGAIGGGTTGAQPKPTNPIENVPAPGTPSKPGDGTIAVEPPIEAAPVPEQCIQVTNTIACVNGPTFCSAKTKSGKTLTVSAFAGACQSHLEASLKEKACAAKETLDLSTLLCGAPR
jgi:hypothetical protein